MSDQHIGQQAWWLIGTWSMGMMIDGDVILIKVNQIELPILIDALITQMMKLRFAPTA